MKKLFIMMSLLFNITLTSVNALEVTMEEKITGLYVAFFDRAADQDGLTYWMNKAEVAQNSGGSLTDVLKELSEAFAWHPTFSSTYAALDESAWR